MQDKDRVVLEGSRNGFKSDLDFKSNVQYEYGKGGVRFGNLSGRVSVKGEEWNKKERVDGGLKSNKVWSYHIDQYTDVPVLSHSSRNQHQKETDFKRFGYIKMKINKQEKGKQDFEKFDKKIKNVERQYKGVFEGVKDDADFENKKLLVDVNIGLESGVRKYLITPHNHPPHLKLIIQGWNIFIPFCSSFQ